MGKENKSRYALLGMLSLAPMSGYDLKKMISWSIGHFWNESYPQIYPALKQLTQEGLTTDAVEKQEGRPDRHVYSLTDKGWDELRQWLTEPFEYQVERNELLLKLMFGGFVPVPRNVEHIERHRAVQVQRLQIYAQTEARLRATQANHALLPYWLITLSYGKHIAQAMLDWCDETLLALEAVKSQTNDNSTPPAEEQQKRKGFHHVKSYE